MRWEGTYERHSLPSINDNCAVSRPPFPLRLWALILLHFRCFGVYMLCSVQQCICPTFNRHTFHLAVPWQTKNSLSRFISLTVTIRALHVHTAQILIHFIHHWSPQMNEFLILSIRIHFPTFIERIRALFSYVYSISKWNNGTSGRYLREIGGVRPRNHFDHLQTDF